MKKSIISLSIAMGLAANAQAAVLDFTASSPWAAANNATTYTEAGSGVTLTASGTPSSANNPARITFNAPSCGNAGVGLACQGDGLGVNRTSPLALLDQNDDIDLNEILKVDFGQMVDILKLDFLNLTYNVIPVIGTVIAESIQVRANGTGAWSTLTQTAANAGGYFTTAAFAPTGIQSLEFRGLALNNGSLARIEYAVPTPASFALMGIGAMGLLVANRRKAKASS